MPSILQVWLECTNLAKAGWRNCWILPGLPVSAKTAAAGRPAAAVLLVLQTGQQCAGGLVLVLPGVQAEVVALCLQQVGVAALLHDPAVLHHQDEVGVLHRGQPVGDNDGGPTLDDGVDGGLDLLFPG